jgi:cytochrome c biogenesis protein CcmG/thiol:disulfide interchange protein DsbE
MKLGSKAIAFVVVAVCIAAAVFYVFGSRLGASAVLRLENPSAAPSAEETLPASSIGKAAPDFLLPDLHGNTVALSNVIGRKPVVLNFWASWCGPCQEETPDLIKTYNAYKDRVLFYGINGTSQDSAEAAKKFAGKYGIPYPVLLDKQGTVMERYGILGFPTTFVIDTKGRIVNMHVGLLTEIQFKAMLDKVLQQS